MENNFHIESGAVSDRGLSEKRPHNEDSFLENKKDGIFAVADGVGGAQAGDVASQMTVEILGEAFANMQKGDDPEVVMRLAFERANSSIFQMANDLPQLSTMATTIVALHISGNIATIGHVGDSRLYRLDKNLELFRETDDHSIVEEEVRAGRMTYEQAANHPSRNVISRAIGAEGFVEIDLKTIMFEPGTVFLICSDGITRHISDKEIKNLLSADASSDSICQKMKQICYERGAEDNLTAVIIKVFDKLQTANGNNVAAVEHEDERTVTTPRFNNSNQTVETRDILQTAEIRVPEHTMPVIRKSNPITIHAEDNKEEKTVEIGADARKELNDAVPVKYPEKKSSAACKVFLSLLFLFLGTALGASAYHFLFPKQEIVVAPPAIYNQNETAEYKKIEDMRRAADENPQQFTFDMQGKTTSPEEFYLLGRAYLLTGKNQEARQALTEAKKLLASTSHPNSRILANEIAMCLAILNTESAVENFKKELPASNAAQSTNVNSNAQ